MLCAQSAPHGLSHTLVSAEVKRGADRVTIQNSDQQLQFPHSLTPSRPQVVVKGQQEKEKDSGIGIEKVCGQWVIKKEGNGSPKMTKAETRFCRIKHIQCTTNYKVHVPYYFNCRNLASLQRRQVRICRPKIPMLFVFAQKYPPDSAGGYWLMQFHD